MVDKITTNPQRSEAVVNKDGLPTDQAIEWNDDIELALNENLLGDSVKHPIYKANQSPSELPSPENNHGGIIFATGLTGLPDASFPLYASTDLGTTIFPINSVSNPGGITQFNHTFASTQVNREVIISGFVSNPTYNGTFKTTASGSGFFQISSIVFTGTETGGKFIFGSNWFSFLQNAVVV